MLLVISLQYIVYHSNIYVVEASNGDRSLAFYICDDLVECLGELSVPSWNIFMEAGTNGVGTNGDTACFVFLLTEGPFPVLSPGTDSGPTGRLWRPVAGCRGKGTGCIVGGCKLVAAARGGAGGGCLHGSKYCSPQGALRRWTYYCCYYYYYYYYFYYCYYYYNYYYFYYYYYYYYCFYYYYSYSYYYFTTTTATTTTTTTTTTTNMIDCYYYVLPVFILLL